MTRLRRHRSGRVAVVAAAALLTFAGCSRPAAAPEEPADSPSGSAEAQATPDPLGIQAGLTRSISGPDPSDEVLESSRCMVGEILNKLTYKDMQAAGILDEQFQVKKKRGFLPRPAAEKWAAAQYPCFDYVESGFRALDPEHPGMDKASFRACMEEATTVKDAQAAAVAMLVGEWKSRAMVDYTETQLTCMEESGGTRNADSEETAEESTTEG